MEKIEKIKEFINGSGDGCGFGSGYGDGDGDGFGSGYGYDYGSGYGYDSGSGHGFGYGSGFGSNSGDGYGSNYGSGYNSGDGYGSGFGSGYGDGDGDGFGSGYGYDYGSGIKITKLNKDLIYYIDGVPTIIDKIRGNIAKGKIVNLEDFSTKECFIAKNGRYFAHENTIQQAVQSVQNKVYANMDIDCRIEEFRNKFKSDIEYNANDFYLWHNILTGSCEAGRNHFIKNNNIDMNKKYKVNEFIQICKNAYGGEVIKRLKEYYV